jgi:hypothetical protein
MRGYDEAEIEYDGEAARDEEIDRQIRERREKDMEDEDDDG